MKYEIDYIEKIAKIVADNQLTEITLEDGEQAIVIRKEATVVASANNLAALSLFNMEAKAGSSMIFTASAFLSTTYRV